MTDEPREPQTEPSAGAELPSTRINRLAERQRHDREALHDVLDSALLRTSRWCGTAFRWSCPCCTPGTATACCCTAPRVGDCCARPRRARR